MIDPRDIENRFAYHKPPDEARAEAHATAREICRAAADLLNDLIPDGREKAVVMTKLEEALFWATAALAREQTQQRSEIA